MTRRQFRHLGAMLFSLALLVGTVAATAAEPAGEGFTLKHLYQMALKRAEQIDIAEENLAIAENLRTQALSVLVPRLSAMGSYTRYTEEVSVMGSVAQPQWEGAYGLRLGQSFTLNGREIAALRGAERGIDKSRSDLNDVKERYLFNVAQAFYDVAKAHQAVAIAQANVKRLEAHRDAVTARLKLGDVPVTELYRSEAELADAQAGLIQAQNGLQLNRASLASLVGATEQLDIVEDPAADDSLAVQDLKTAQQMAAANRWDLKSLAFQEEMAQHQVTYTKGSYWPRVGVEAGWMRILQDPESVLDESSYVAVSMEMDLFDAGLRRAQVSDARRQRRQAELAYQDARRKVMVEVEQVWLYWKSQQEIIRSYESQLRYATENYDAVIRLFEHGMANSVDVMDANTLLVTAQRQLSEARYNVHLAALGVNRAAGVFLSAIEPGLRGDSSSSTTP